MLQQLHEGTKGPAGSLRLRAVAGFGATLLAMGAPGSVWNIESAAARASDAVRTVVFKDADRLFHRVGPSGFNKTGYVTMRNVVVYPRGYRGLGRAPLNSVTKRPHSLLERPAGSEQDLENVDRFFEGNVPSVELFYAGMHAISNDADLSFFRNPIRLPVLRPVTRVEFEAKWGVLRQSLRPGDLIFLVDTASVISRAIAHFDHGTWSHVATCSGKDRLIEALPRGVVERDVEVYHHPRYRLGLYRAVGPGYDPVAIVEQLRTRLGARFNFRGFARLALAKLMSRRLAPRRSSETSPNDIARSPRIGLIHLV